MLKNNHFLYGILLGSIVGISLFCVESFFIILSGSRIPLSYLSLTFVIDTLSGSVLGFAAGILTLIVMPWIRAEKEQRRFDLLVSHLLFLLAFSLGFFFLHGRILAGSKFYEFKGLFSTLCLAVLCLLLSFCFYHLIPKIRDRFFKLYPSCLSEILFLESLALGYLWLNEHKLVGSQRTTLLIMDGLLILSLGIGYLLLSFLFSRFSSRRNSVLERSSLTFSLIVLMVGLAGLSLFWSSSYFPLDSYSSPELQVNEGKEENEDRFNIVLISVDTLRASNLSCYGYSLDTSPHIDRFAEDALIFTNTVSSSSWTLPAHASLFTGLIPYHHGAHYAEQGAPKEEGEPLHELDMAGVRSLPSKHITLAEALNRGGYNNAAFVSNFAALAKSLGVAQGFDLYIDRERTWVTFWPFYHRILRTLLKDFGFLQDFVNRTIKPFRSAEEISSEAIRWLRESRKEPFFLFLNYMEPHTPYLPYPPYHQRFMKERVISMRDPFWDVMSDHRPLKERERDYLMAQYDGEIAYADLHIGRLLDHLKSIDLYDESMIILLSDHGELFGEHDLLRHTSLYEEVLKIPLIVKYPFSEKRGKEKERVGIVDVMPEILSRLKLTLPDFLDGAPFEGRNVNPMAELYVNPYYYKEFGERFGDIQRAKYQGPFKLIASSSQRHELYHLEEDPREMKNLAGTFPDLQDQILRQIKEGLTGEKPWEDQPEVLDEETREKLKSLGYLD
jgi:arylsulfatase A-like enzyme